MTETFVCVDLSNMFLVPDVSEGPTVDYDVLGDPPRESPVYGKDESGEFVQIPEKKAIFYGDGGSEVVSDIFVLVSHHDLFSYFHDLVQDQWFEHFWKVETAVSHEGVRARGTWFFWSDEMKFAVGRDEWGLQLRVFNSYDGFFSLSAELGVVNRRHGGRLAFRCTSFMKRRRGKDPTARVAKEAASRVEDAHEIIVPHLERMEDHKVEGEEEVREILSNFEELWFPQKEKKRVRLRFLADEENTSLLDLLGLVGWYAAKRISAINRQVMYQQELLFREVADVGGIK